MYIYIYIYLYIYIYIHHHETESLAPLGIVPNPKHQVLASQA